MGPGQRPLGPHEGPREDGLGAKNEIYVVTKAGQRTACKIISRTIFRVPGRSTPEKVNIQSHTHANEKRPD